MNKIEEQILKNQWAIMKSLFNQDDESDTELVGCLDDTNDLLNQKEEDSIEKQQNLTDDAFCEVSDE